MSELDRIGEARELELTVGGRAVTIWVVRVGDELYVRSYRGSGAAWFRRARATGAAHISAGGVEQDVALVERHDVDDAVDAAYRAKYRRSGYVDAMATDEARATTLQLVT